MATYERTVDLTNESHVLGAGSPPAWYTTAVADGTILENKPSTGKYKVGQRAVDGGWIELETGDYVTYVAAAGQVPKYFIGRKKAAFEAVYQLDV